MLFEDGALLSAFGAVSNKLLGFGGDRDPLAATEINTTPYIDFVALEQLYRNNRIIEKAIAALPHDSVSNWGNLQIGNELEGSLDPKSAKLVEQSLLDLNIPSLFAEAGTAGRLYGDGFLILGINDGGQYKDPVQENKIKSIDWVKLSDPNQIKPYLPTQRGEFEHYQIVAREYGEHNQSDLDRTDLIHKSRVLRFPGKKLFGQMYVNTFGLNDSIIQAMYSEFIAWSSSVSSSGAMLNSHSLFIYKIKGLAEAAKTNNRQGLYNRFSSMLMGLSSLKSLVIDSNGEDASFINRNYGGVQSILAELKENLASAADMPYTKIWGTPTGGAFSESGASDRYEWANAVDRYQRSMFIPALNQLTRYLLLAQNRRIPNSWQWMFPSVLQLSLKEQSELQKNFAASDQINVTIGALHPLEVRHSRFGESQFGNDIELNQDLEKQLSSMNTTPNTTPTADSFNDSVEGDPLSDEELDAIADITEEDKKNAIEHWRASAGETWRNLLESDVE
jgi:phage-related protein (TIGR01555 family)